MCFMTFQKYMLCNERSEIKVDECNLFNGSFFNYPCYEEIELMFDVCGPDLFEPMFELYRVRLMNGTLKPKGHSRLITHMDAFGTTKDRKVLHY